MRYHAGHILTAGKGLRVPRQHGLDKGAPLAGLLWRGFRVTATPDQDCGKADTPGMMPCFDPIPELEMQRLMLISPEAYRRREVKAFVSHFAPRYAALYR